MKVLIIDNDPSMCQLLTMAFNHADVQALATGSLVKMAQLLKDESVGALLMDYHLGGGQSGTEVLKRIINDGTSLPFWLVTGTPDEPGVAEASTLKGFQAVIAKPFSIKDLVSEVVPFLSGEGC